MTKREKQTLAVGLLLVLLGLLLARKAQGAAPLREVVHSTLRPVEWGY